MVTVGSHAPATAGMASNHDSSLYWPDPSSFTGLPRSSRTMPLTVGMWQVWQAITGP